jgi:hypothetical protein
MKHDWAAGGLSLPFDGNEFRDLLFTAAAAAGPAAPRACCEPAGLTPAEDVTSE